MPRHKMGSREKQRAKERKHRQAQDARATEEDYVDQADFAEAAGIPKPLKQSTPEFTFSVPAPFDTTISVSEQAGLMEEPTLTAPASEHSDGELNVSEFARLLGIDYVPDPVPVSTEVIPGRSSTASPFDAAEDIPTWAARDSSVAPTTEGPSTEVLNDLLKATRETLNDSEVALEDMREQNLNLSCALVTSQNQLTETKTQSEAELEALRKQLMDESGTSAKVRETNVQSMAQLQVLNNQLAEARRIFERQHEGMVRLKTEVDSLHQKLAVERQISTNYKESIAQLTSDMETFRKELEENAQLKAELEAFRKEIAEKSETSVKTTKENAKLRAQMEFLSKEVAEIAKKQAKNAKAELKGVRRQLADESEMSAKRAEEIALLRAQLGVSMEISETSAKNADENITLKAQLEVFNKEQAEISETSAKNADENIKLKAQLEVFNKEQAEISRTLAKNAEAEQEELRKQLAKESEILAKKVEENAQFRSQLAKACELSGTHLEKISVLTATSRKQKQQLKEQELKMAAKRVDLQSAIEKLKVSESEKVDLQNQYDTVTDENYSLQVRLDELERSLKKTKSTNADDIRQKNQQIGDHLAVIATREEQLKAIEEDLKYRGRQLKEKDDKLRAKESDYIELSFELKEIERSESNLIANCDELTKALEAAKKENEELQYKIDSIEREIGDRAALEVVLAEAEVNSKSLNDDITHLEDQNRQLRSRLARIGHKRESSNVEAIGRSLKDEVDGADFFTSPSGDENPSDSTKAVDTLIVAEHQAPEFDRSELTNIQHERANLAKGKEEDTLKAVGTARDNIQESNSTKSAKSEESEAIGVTIVHEMQEQSDDGREKEIEMVVDTKIVYVEKPSVVTYVKHNPIACWFRVEKDLIILLLFFCTKMLRFLSFLSGYRTKDQLENPPSNTLIFDDLLASTVPFAIEEEAEVETNAPEIEAVSSPTLTDEGIGRSAKESSGSAINVGSFAPLSTALSATRSIDSAVPVGNVLASTPSVLDPSLVWRTLLYFFLHVLFYLLVLICAWNYSSLRSEMQIWRAGNELTHRLFWKYYGSVGSGRRCYGAFHHIFGEVEYAQKLHFYLQTWSRLNRAFPG